MRTKLKKLKQLVVRVFSFEVSGYDPVSIIAATLMFFGLAILDGMLLMAYSDGHSFNSLQLVQLIAVHLILLPLIFVGPVSCLLRKMIGTERLHSFLELTEQEGGTSRLTFPVLSNFLSEQALASFLITAALVLYAKLLDTLPAVLVFMLAFAVCVAATCFAWLSGYRFVKLSTKVSSIRYVFVAMSAFTIALLFLAIGFLLAN